jgi:hypothetical protein
MTRTSESIATLAVALLAAQQKMENVDFDSTNPHFKNQYAGLPGVLAEVKAKLNANDIAVLQFPTEAPEGHLGLTTRLQHKGGEFIEATAIVPLPKSDPQGFGSAMTYTRRYALLSITGLVGEKDDDANAASNARPNAEPRPAPKGKLPFNTGRQIEDKPAAETAKPPEKGKKSLFPTPKGAGSAE